MKEVEDNIINYEATMEEWKPATDELFAAAAKNLLFEIMHKIHKNVWLETAIIVLYIRAFYVTIYSVYLRPKEYRDEIYKNAWYWQRLCICKCN